MTCCKHNAAMHEDTYISDEVQILHKNCIRQKKRMFCLTFHVIDCIRWAELKDGKCVLTFDTNKACVLFILWKPSFKIGCLRFDCRCVNEGKTPGDNILISYGEINQHFGFNLYSITQIAAVLSQTRSMLTSHTEWLRSAAVLFFSWQCEMPHRQLYASACHRCHAGSRRQQLNAWVSRLKQGLIFTLTYLAFLSMLYIVQHWLTPRSAVIFTWCLSKCTPVHRHIVACLYVRSPWLDKIVHSQWLLMIGLGQ